MHKNCVTTMREMLFRCAFLTEKHTFYFERGFAMNNENLICPICGEPTNVYMGNARRDRLCRKHGSLANKGEIIQCENCGKWNNVGETCSCKAPKTVVPEPSTENAASELTCIICGEASNGKHFCLNCYRKYKDRAIDLRIINCKDAIMLDEYGNTVYKCDDGRKVRSKSEKIISDFLFKYGIRTVYEKAVYYYPNENETITLHPDFYLPDYDCYIEHNGVDTKSYKANKKKTEEMYKSLNYKVIVTTETDLADIEARLKPILRIN